MDKPISVTAVVALIKKLGISYRSNGEWYGSGFTASVDYFTKVPELTYYAGRVSNPWDGVKAECRDVLKLWDAFEEKGWTFTAIQNSDEWRGMNYRISPGPMPGLVGGRKIHSRDLYSKAMQKRADRLMESSREEEVNRIDAKISDLQKQIDLLNTEKSKFLKP